VLDEKSVGEFLRPQDHRETDAVFPERVVADERIELGKRARNRVLDGARDLDRDPLDFFEVASLADCHVDRDRVSFDGV
jgi:hypothetical protein